MGKEFIKNLKGDGINEYKMIKIDKDALKKSILKIRYNNGRKLIIIIIICTLFTKYWNKVCKFPKFTTQVVSQICKKGY